MSRETEKCGTCQKDLTEDEPWYREYNKQGVVCLNCAASRQPDPTICGFCVFTEGPGGGYYYCDDPVQVGQKRCRLHVFSENIDGIVGIFRPWKDDETEEQLMQRVRAMKSDDVTKMQGFLQGMLNALQKKEI